MKARWILLLAVALLAGVFAYLNGSERTTLNFGFMVLYRVPLTVVVFGAFLLGMITMFLFALRHDLRVRRALREHRVDRAPSESWSESPPP